MFMRTQTFVVSCVLEKDDFLGLRTGDEGYAPRNYALYHRINQNYGLPLETDEECYEFLRTGRTVRPNRRFSANEIVFGVLHKSSDGTYSDVSIGVPVNSSGTLVRLSMTHRSNDVCVLMAEFSSIKTPGRGDKYDVSTMPSKGVIGQLVNEIDLPTIVGPPLAAERWPPVPDIVVCTSAQARRRTLSQLHMTVINTLVAMTGDRRLGEMLSTLIGMDLHMAAHELFSPEKIDPDTGEAVEIKPGVVNRYFESLRLHTRRMADMSDAQILDEFRELRNACREVWETCWVRVMNGSTGERIGMWNKDGSFDEPRFVFVGLIPVEQLAQIASEKASRPGQSIRKLGTNTSDSGKYGNARHGRQEDACLVAHGASNIAADRMSESGDGMRVNYCMRCRQIMSTTTCPQCSKALRENRISIMPSVAETFLPYAIMRGSHYANVLGGDMQVVLERPINESA